MIELAKGQDLPLEHTRLRIGLGWDSDDNTGILGTGRPDVDLDASAVQFAGDQLFDLVFYNNLATRDGSTTHLGDNLTGDGKGDDEQITVDLSRVHGPVDQIVLLVSSYQGHSLEWVGRASCRVVATDGPAGEEEELGRLTLSGGTSETGLVMGKLVRGDAGWSFRALGEPVAATTPTDAIGRLRRFL